MKGRAGVPSVGTVVVEVLGEFDYEAGRKQAFKEGERERGDRCGKVRGQGLHQSWAAVMQGTWSGTASELGSSHDPMWVQSQEMWLHGKVYMVRDCIIRVGQQQSCVSYVGNNRKK